MLKRLWKWVTMENPKLKTMQDVIYENMWDEINQESLIRGSEKAQQYEDNKNISENLKLAGFDLD